VSEAMYMKEDCTKFPRQSSAHEKISKILW